MVQLRRLFALQHKASALQPSAALGDADEDEDEGSGDWDIMGSDTEAAIAPSAGPQALHSPDAASGGRRSTDKAKDLQHVPVYETGEPQYTFGDGGGAPIHSRFFAAVQDLANADRPSTLVCTTTGTRL